MLGKIVLSYGRCTCKNNIFSITILGNGYYGDDDEKDYHAELKCTECYKEYKVHDITENPCQWGLDETNFSASDVLVDYYSYYEG